MTDGQLQKILREENDKLEAEMKSIQERISSDQTRLREIVVLLDHVKGILSSSSQGSESSDQVTMRDSTSAEDIAEKILKGNNKTPMYYKDIAEKIRSMGGDLPGENPGALLVSRLVRDKRFVRPSRKGFYALRDDYPEAKNIGQRRKYRR